MSSNQSILQRLREKQAEVDESTQTAAESDVAVAEERAFEIGDADIKRNAVYQIATDETKLQKDRVEQITALRQYNPDLTPEENAQNAQAFDEFILYCENKILELAQRQAAFTNDDAFSLYDQNIARLQDGLTDFKSAIGPLVDAFRVMELARNNGIPPHTLLKEVQDLRDRKSDLAAQRSAKEDEIERVRKQLQPLQAEAARVFAGLEGHNAAIEAAKRDKATAQAALDAEKAKFVWRRNRKAIAGYEGQISSANGAIESHTASIEALSTTATVMAKDQEGHEAQLAARQAELATIMGEVKAADNALTDDPNTLAIAKLLEITGEEFKEARESLTNGVTELITNSVKDFERSMARFDSGHGEVTTMRHTVMNVKDLNDLISVAARDAEKADSAYIMEQKAIADRIRGEKGEDAVLDPDYERATRHYRHANMHSESGRGLARKTGEFAERLARQNASYLGLAEAFEQKGRDAQRLRTHAAVEVSSRLLTTIKGLELAIASERTNVADSILADLGGSAMETTKQIFDMVAQGASAQNERLASALKQAIDVNQAITDITTSLADEARTSELQQRALDEITKDINAATADLETVQGDTAREVAGREDLQEAFADTALDAVGKSGGTKPGSGG